MMGGRVFDNLRLILFLVSSSIVIDEHFCHQIGQHEYDYRWSERLLEDNEVEIENDAQKWPPLISVGGSNWFSINNDNAKTTWSELINNTSSDHRGRTRRARNEKGNSIDINGVENIIDNSQSNQKDSLNSTETTTELWLNIDTPVVTSPQTTSTVPTQTTSSSELDNTNSSSNSIPTEMGKTPTSHEEDDILNPGIDDGLGLLNLSTIQLTENMTCEEDSPDIYCHNLTCVGNPLYCNMSYEEYMSMLNDYIYPSTLEWILILAHCVVFIMGLVGNALVCIAVYTNYSMRTVTNIFIVNLAVADFFVILFCLPPTVVWDVTETWFMGNAMCKVVLYFQTVSVTVSVLTLTFISIDRWYAICFPLRYRTKISRAIISVVLIWVVAILSDIPEFLVLTTKSKELRFGSKLFTQCQSTWTLETEKNFQIARIVMLYMLPLILMTIAYFKIIRVLWKSDTIPGHRESRNHKYTCGYVRGSCIASANTSTMGQLRARRKAAKMLVAVVVMFAGCYFPVHFLNILRYTNDIGQNEIVTIISLFSHWLCYANSAVNPVIYNFMSGKFRREFRNALDKCRCGRVRVEDRSLNHSTPASRINNISPSSRSNYQLTSVRDITRDVSRHTVQTTFIDNCGNGHPTTPTNNLTKTERVP